MAIRPRPVDTSFYFTVQNPESIDPDWKTFYTESYQRTLDFAERADGVRSELGVLYGDDPAQMLDVFAPEDAVDAPVFAFWHGGGFREGHPSHYGYLAEHLIARGAVVVSLGYRLAPEVDYPDSIGDGALGLAWIQDGIARFGGDPANVYLAGHSAGAMIAAGLSFRDCRDLYGIDTAGIRGSVLLSGGYDFELTDPQYPTQSRWPAETAAVHNIATAPPQVLVVYGAPELQRKGQDPGFFAFQSKALIDALRARRIEPRVIVVPDTTHLDTTLLIGDPSSPVFAAITDMMFPAGAGRAE